MGKINKNKVREILKLYSTLEFGGSFASISKFRKALKEKKNINISYNALSKILKGDPYYLTSYKRPYRYLHRKITSQGVFIEGLCDIAYIFKSNLDIKFYSLIVQDIHSRFVYAIFLNVLNKKSVKNAFLTLFRHGMPQFSILRSDADPIFQGLKSFFNKRKMYLAVRKVGAGIPILDNSIRTIKDKIFKHLRIHSNDSNFKEILKNAVLSYNTSTNVHSLTPQEANTELLDPYIRKQLYGSKKLMPFTELFKKSSKIQNELLDPHSKSQIYKIGDEVLVDLAKPMVSRYYDIPRNTIYRISNVLTEEEPFLYSLTTLDDKEKQGYFYASELYPVDWKNKNPSKILQSKKDYQKLEYFNNPEFNRWQKVD